VSIERLIESIGESPDSLRKYLLDEIDEFLEAESPAHQEDEFGDVLFALAAMAWAHTGRHFPLHTAAFEGKVRTRLRKHAALTRYPRVYEDERIAEMEFGVVHFAFGQFGGQWHQFDPLLNGTVAEIHLLTDAPFDRSDRITNHCIVTFDEISAIEYDILYASTDPTAGNTIRCRIPNFMFARAKKELRYSELSEFLSLQVLAALDGLRFPPGAIAHFHSWESGFLMESEEFRERIGAFKTMFSPYLTIGRLKALVDDNGGEGWTMSPDELRVASEYERKLSAATMRVVLESARDHEFYGRWVHPDRLEVRSFAREGSAAFRYEPPDPSRLDFLAGGRPVREKGFVELCREFAAVAEWAAGEGVRVSLGILCRERRVDKGARYIAEMERVIQDHGLEGLVTIEPKVSLDQLRKRIEASSALVVPSLFDPFNLMPTYAVEVRRPAFVSTHAGVSDNVKSRQYTFDPLTEGDLARAISAWHAEVPEFEYEACFPSYRDLYLAKEAPQPWA